MRQEKIQPGLGGGAPSPRPARRALMIATIVAISAAAGSAGSAPVAKPGASERIETHRPVADRTLVPKRIRLIIGWTRPRLV